MNAVYDLQKGYYSGTSGLQLHIPKYLFPPPYENASRLEYYATFFNSIEVNSSFYKIPQPATVTKWSDSVNDNFRFTFKLWKEITHCKGFDFKKKDVELYMKTISHVQHKKGCLLIQLPPSLGKEYRAQLKHLLQCIQKMKQADWKIAIEFRNKSWYNEATYHLLNSFKAALVIHDIPKSATPLVSHETDFLYIRFHGPTGNYRDSYPEEFLKEYASYVKDWLDEGKKVFLYFNNTMGNALNNLEMINSYLSNQPDHIK